MILRKIFSLIGVFKRVHQKDFCTGRIYTLMSSFFFLVKQRPFFDKFKKKQKNYYLLSFEKKIYKTKNEHTLFYELFFSL